LYFDQWILIFINLIHYNILSEAWNHLVFRQEIKKTRQFLKYLHYYISFRIRLILILKDILRLFFFINYNCYLNRIFDGNGFVLCLWARAGTPSIIIIVLYRDFLRIFTVIYINGSRITSVYKLLFNLLRYIIII